MREMHPAPRRDRLVEAAYGFCALMSLLLFGLAAWTLLSRDYGPGLIGLAGAIALAIGLLVERAASARERL